MAAATRLVIDVPSVILVVLFTGVMLALELTLPYHRYARVLRWLALSLLAYIFVLATVDIDWSAVASNLISPDVTFNRAELAALLAVFGTTVSPYLFFWQASEEVEEEQDEGADSTALTDEHLSAMRVDVIGGMGSAVAIAFVIMLVAATTLHPAGLTQVATADQAADALRPLAGDLAGLLFAVGIVGLGLLAVPVLAGSSAYALSEAVAWHEGLSQTFRQAKGFYVVLAGFDARRRRRRLLRYRPDPCALLRRDTQRSRRTTAHRVDAHPRPRPIGVRCAPERTAVHRDREQCDRRQRPAARAVRALPVNTTRHPSTER